jgi:hypothetical protein
MHDAPKTKRKFLVGTFADEDHLLHATEEARTSGLPIHDCFTPYPVHGLETAQGLPRSKLTFVCFGGGALGFLTAVSLQVYTQGIETGFLSGWPLNVGGKPFIPNTAFVPVCFELTVLFAGLCSAFGLFAFCGLFPGNKVSLPIDGVSDDRFAIALDPDGPGFDEAKARALMQHHHAVEVAYLAEV